MAGIVDNIQSSAGEAGGCVTRSPAELAIRAGSVDRCARGEGHAEVVLFNDVAPMDGSDDSAHNFPSFVLVVFAGRFCGFSNLLYASSTQEPRTESARTPLEISPQKQQE